MLTNALTFLNAQIFCSEKQQEEVINKILNF